MKIGINKKVQVEAKRLHIFMKVRDSFSAVLLDQDGDEIFDQEDGYVPSIMPGDHHGDYLDLEIDIDTGMILNWVVPTVEKIELFINQRDD